MEGTRLLIISNKLSLRATQRRLKDHILVEGKLVIELKTVEVLTYLK